MSRGEVTRSARMERLLVAGGDEADVSVELGAPHFEGFSKTDSLGRIKQHQHPTIGAMFNVEKNECRSISGFP